MPTRVCVIGAGIIGLSTAVRIIETLDDVTVTIVTEKVTPATTSDGAGGFWHPYLMGETPLKNLREWGSATYNHLKSLSEDPIAKAIGIQLVSGCEIFKRKTPEPFWKDIVLDYNLLSQADLHNFPDYSYGWKFTTVVCEGKRYLPWLMTRFRDRGGVVVNRKITAFDELYDNYDVTVNCAGLGARELCGDQRLVPIKGQITKVEAPWITRFLIDDDKDICILINSDCVILGGTREAGTENLSLNLDEKQRIWEGCCSLIPSLKDSRHIGDWVGLRPSRDRIRLDMETKHHGNIPKKLVHNYGHGGGGITLHWGCAEAATQFVQQGILELSVSKL